MGTSSTPNYNARAQNSSNNATTTVQGIKLDKTESQFDNVSENAQRKFKEAAEAYLESIIEFKSDFEKDLGVTISTYMEFNQFTNILPKFEIDGKIKVRYDFSLKFYVLHYDQNNRMTCRKEIYVGQKRTNSEVVQTCIDPSEYHKISNIKNSGLLG